MPAKADPKTQSQLAEGQAVRLADREPSAADTKSQLFYSHYRGLTGTITKLYDDDTANVSVDFASLPVPIRARHAAGTDAMRQKWLDGLSEEARSRLSATEKQFALRYSLLVSVSDLTPSDTLLDSASDSPARRSAADIEADEARHLAEVTQKRKSG